MLANDTKNKIPVSTKPFFQEYDFSTLDVNRYKPLIIERLLAYGSRREVKWLIRSYGKPDIRSWLELSGKKHLPKRRYHLWCLVFGLPEPKKSQRIWTH